MYVTEKAGRVIRLRDGRSTTVRDFRRDVSTTSAQGLLGITISDQGLMYLYMTDREGDARLVEVDLRASRREPRELLRIQLPYADHPGGALAFGPDGFLYVSVGDGGTPSDVQSVAQDLGSLRGKILRIDPQASAEKPYSIPEGNPFVDDADSRAEIWHYGLRNPWRFSFDRTTDEMWIADAGQHKVEEINRVPSGRSGLNFGWPNLEGSFRFQGGDVPQDHALPFYEYENPGGACRAVIGGFVYHGELIPALKGRYVYGDFCQADLFALRVSEHRGTEPLGVSVPNVSALGEDADGELLVLSLTGDIFRLEPAS